MTFRKSFIQTDVAQCILDGIQALGPHSRLVESNEPDRFNGSVNIDLCLSDQFPQDHRWDYAFGYGKWIYYIEVHHVNDSEVKTIISKYRWLKDWQNRQPNPSALKTNSYYLWVSSGKGVLTKNSRYTRSLSIAGLDYPKRSLVL